MTGQSPASTSAWVVSDAAAGNERQALALAGAMRLAPEVLRLNLRAPWAWFAPRLMAGARLALPAATRTRLTPPWPTLAIGCGRQSALLLRLLRGLSGGVTFCVQILDPRIAPQYFDLVIAPRHDALTGANVIRTLGALNPVDEAWLADGLAQFPNLAQLPQPRMTVLIGGPRHGLDMSDAWFEAFLARVNALAASAGGSVLVSTSRRTPDTWRALSRQQLRADCVHFWNGAQDGASPYSGYLAAANRIVVTPDSVNMLSEACATGTPVFTWLPATAQGKLVALHAELRDQGWLHVLDNNVYFSTLQQPPPLRELGIVAGKVWHVLEATRPHAAVALGGN